MKKLTKVLLVIIVILVVLLGTFMSKYYDQKYDLLFMYDTVPNLDLTNSLGVDQTSGIRYGHIRGFVAFDDITKQPKGLKQYYVIEPLNEADANKRQLFSIEEIIAMDYLPPTSTGTSILTVTGNSNSTITLEDKEGNRFFVNKNTGDISMLDMTGDKTHLIVSNTEFKDFILELRGYKK